MVKGLIEKHQQKNGVGSGKIIFSPEALRYIEQKLSYIPGMNVSSNSSVEQSNQKTRITSKIDKEVPKTVGEGHARTNAKYRKTILLQILIIQNVR